MEDGGREPLVGHFCAEGLAAGHTQTPASPVQSYHLCFPITEHFIPYDLKF